MIWFLVFEQAEPGDVAVRRRLDPGDHFGALAPLTLTQPIGQKPPVRVDPTPSATGPALIAWAAGLALILAAAFVIYRRRARAILHT